MTFPLRSNKTHLQHTPYWTLSRKGKSRSTIKPPNRNPNAEQNELKYRNSILLPAGWLRNKYCQRQKKIKKRINKSYAEKKHFFN